ncbi:hypothetical protein VTJ49DRAFT_6797 [Mycothermus thermophilus]|uniref:Uncharacterized protein n=1 Tax=Humicola insolens TaxID=85995 RepID=A0ABR3VIA5_HUMIN
MHFTTKTLVSVLLAAAAQEAAAAPQREAAGDAQTFTIQTVAVSDDAQTASSSDAAPTAAPTISVSNPAGAATPIPPEVLASIQSSAAAAASSAAEANERAAQSGLRPLPGLQTAGDSATLRPLPGLDTGVVAPTETASDVLASLTNIIALPTATESATVSLRPLPGLDLGAGAGAGAQVSLVPLPGLSTLTSALPSVETSSAVESISTVAPVIGSFTQIVGGVVGTFTLSSLSSTDSAAASPTSTLAGVGSFTQIVGAPSATADQGTDVAQPTGGLAPLPDANAGVGGDSTLSTLPGLNTDIAATDSLQPLPTGDNTDSVSVDPTGTDSLDALPTDDNLAESTGSLRPLPGLTDSTGDVTGSLQPLPTGDSATDSATDSLDSLTSTDVPPATGTGVAALPTGLTTLTTVSNGVTSTLTTAASAVTSSPGAASTGLPPVEAGAARIAGSGPGGVVVAAVAGLVGVMGFLMMARDVSDD